MTENDQPVTVLFLCTGNSARSIMAEGVLNAMGQGRFRAFSAGSRPTGTPNPFAMARLRQAGIDPAFAASKSWDAFAGPDATQVDIVFTVCDSAAAEECPFFPGAPITLHWGLPDPAAATGTDAQIAEAFDGAFGIIERRIQALLALPSVDPKEPGVAQSLRAIAEIW